MSLHFVDFHILKGSLCSFSHRRPSVSLHVNWLALLFEPRHDKTNKMSVHPMKTQISLGIRPVWPESSLWAQRVVKDPSFLHVDSEDSGQTGRMSLRLAHSHFVGFVMSRLIWRWCKFRQMMWHRSRSSIFIRQNRNKANQMIFHLIPDAWKSITSWALTNNGATTIFFFS